MGRVQALIAAAVAGLAAGSGCIHVHLDGETKDKLPTVLKTPIDEAAQGKRADGPLKQASAVFPSGPSLPKMVGKGAGPKGQMVLMEAMWQNRVAYLPDPARNGAAGAGLVGQLLLYGPNWQLATPDGPLTVELYDETPRQGRPTESVFLGRWTFDKDTLRLLRINDERWGPCYALFCPWPDYRADVLRVRLTVKYQPEGGYPIYAEPITMTLDSSPPNVTPPVVTTVVPGMGGGYGMGAGAMSPIGGPPPANNPAAGTMGGSFPAAGSAMPTGGYAPPAASAGGMPAGGYVPPAGSGMPAGGYQVYPTGGYPASPAAGMPPAMLPPAGGEVLSRPAGPQFQPPPTTPMMPVAPTSPMGGAYPGPMPIPTPVNGPGAAAPPPGQTPLSITIPARR
jgi:hypothetical protein